MEKLQKIFNSSPEELAPVYLIYSEEEYLLDQFIDNFRQQFQDQLNDFNLSMINQQQDFYRRVIDSVQTIPLLAQYRYVIARTSDYFTSKSPEDDKFIDFLEKFPEQTTLFLLVTGSIDKRIKINKRIAKTGQVIELKPPRYNELDQWIREQFAAYDKRVDRKTINTLEQMFNNKLQRLEQEIEKIVTFCQDQQEIRFSRIRAVLSRDRLLEETVIFDFVDAISEKDKRKALILLEEMLDSGREALGILSMINRQLRLLISVKELKQQGQYPRQIARELQEHPFPIKKCYQHCDNFTGEELEVLMERFLEANRDIVTGKYNDEKMALELALLGI